MRADAFERKIHNFSTSVITFLTDLLQDTFIYSKWADGRNQTKSTGSPFGPALPLASLHSRNPTRLARGNPTREPVRRLVIQSVHSNVSYLQAGQHHYLN